MDDIFEPMLPPVPKMTFTMDVTTFADTVLNLDAELAARGYGWSNRSQIVLAFLDTVSKAATID